ncbi:flavin-dependent oxidoreductase [Granulosicoccus antarcticus]|uniref:3-hydroxybenzoate 6-hydroxylase 1 n=1 Tax=Granulosicoccus antarcticus IMCC3135 TaxID=1192854 RepID=A0A2Z2NZM5_9GAMM|nr:flavin-dependent oxidoreductase [Granulosicoccus antarcticus]ASJ73267.1 3-hydroxybenzoate 6-hydroxylase 1 [Granulosicoccus antarcticus IMCC3135]
MSQPLVMIAGGGIGGLSLALTLDQIGVPFIVFESVSEMKPLGVGINIQPNAVRELYDLGIDAAKLDRVGLPTREWALVGRKGNDIYSEPRGLEAGYQWPQYGVHRGHFQTLLYQELIQRAGDSRVCLGSRVSGYQNNPDGTVTAIVEHKDGGLMHHTGTLLVGADGIHSAIRAQMHPDQPPIHWGGTMMWRGTTRARPIRTGASFVGLGTHQQRMVIYPISAPDEDGMALINWIAEVNYETVDQRPSGWFRLAQVEDFIEHFQDWSYDWLDVKDLLNGADVVFENPMIDRDPIPSWLDKQVTLMGDAAHAMYPTGSNGASQAIIDARILGAKMLEHGVSGKALSAYNTELCEPISKLVLRNRGAGPFGLLNLVDERCNGVFEDIDAVVSPDERTAFMADYKAVAGLAIDELNRAPQTIAPGSTVLI